MYNLIIYLKLIFTQIRVDNLSYCDAHSELKRLVVNTATVQCCCTCMLVIRKLATL